jgi:two-component system, NtrC family, nitrogen regulation sensor histidine kinase NtrY
MLGTMVRLGSIRWRLAVATAAIAILPLLVAIVVAGSMVRQTAERFYMPEIGMRLDRSLGVYQDLAKAIKTSMRHAADAIAARETLRAAARRRDVEAVRAELTQALESYPGLVHAAVRDSDQKLLVEVDRGSPVDEATERKLDLERPLADGELPGPGLSLLFVTDRARLEELDGMSRFVDTYRQIEQRRSRDERSYVAAFAALLGITVLVAVGSGLWIARGPTVRLVEVASALQRMATGDLTVRVPDRGHDEIGDLSRSFNRMVAEIESSRARIEYLQRIGAWQEMARRLAHEIKNPLTPILLAVQEVQQRCPEDSPAFRHLVDETRRIVEDEVETLRRLVSEFSGFARMPQARLSLGDLASFLRLQRRRFEMLDDTEVPADETPSVAMEISPSISLVLEVPEGSAEAYFDPHMLKRAIVNLVRNAAQAMTGAGKKDGQVVVRLRTEGDYVTLDVMDDGPGIPEAMRQVVFDPYVTTKKTGTGLGLAIVKKIIVEHGGTIIAETSPGGGARICIRLPRFGTPAAMGLAAGDAQEFPLSSRPVSPLLDDRGRTS